MSGGARVTARAEIAALTGVRAFAALWVVALHLRLGPGADLLLPGAVDRFVRLGHLGVDLFGFLSGFVIAYQYAERLARFDPLRTARYLWIRAVRIVPLHWFVLAALVAARLGIEGFGTRPADRHLYGGADLVQQALLLHGWGLARDFSWNLPSWTVSSEWLCYLAFPLVAPWLARLRDGRRAALLAAASLGTTAALLGAAGHPDFDAALRFGAVRIGGEFLTGCLLQRAFAARFAEGARWGGWALGAGALALASAAVGAVLPTVAACALLVLALAWQQGPLCRALAARPVVRLGEASYALYLVHWPVLRLLSYVGPTAPGGSLAADPAARVAWHLAWIVAAALAAHWLVESPARRRLRRVVAPP
jgi:peptidoglycan/LPS O-acetylase OafA/YrhL